MSRLVTDHLPLLAGAPNGVKKLRELILELAVRGKLVAQDSGDEPASSLINKIQTTKINLVVNGVIKSSKALKFISNEETPFPAPSGWTWARAENISETIVDCPHSTPKFMASGMLCLDTSSFKQGEFVAHRLRYVDEITFNERNARLIPKPGDIVFAREGSVGESVVIPDGTSCCLGQRVMLFRPCLISSAYFRFAISGPGFLNRLLAVHKGIGAKHVNVADMRDALVPIPPLAEQHRIVAKIDELMALCDRLETRQSDAQAAHARLVDELLGSLLQARDAEDFSASWERLAGCFEAVFSTEESVEILASAIRKFAFSGKISSHRQEGKWTASKLKYAVSFLNGYAFKSEWFLRQGIKLARNINISHGNIDWTEMACIDADQAKEFKNFELKVGDILLSLDRPLISTGLKVAVVSENDLPCLLLQRVAKIIPSEDKIVPEFLLHWLHSPFFMNEIDPGRSNGVPHISTKQVGNMDLLLPPLEEQRRIVAKLDEILALCDRLKVGIRQARQMQERLVGTLVERAVL